MTPEFQQQIYEFLAESQFFTVDQIRRQQLHQLEQLVRFTKREVPFYQSRLAHLFDANDVFQFDQWPNVPILTRADLLKNREQMLAKKLPDGHGQSVDHVGSGTTGQTVTTRHNSLIGFVSRLSFFRAMDWHQYDYSQNLFSWFGSTAGENLGPEGTDWGNWGPSWNKSSAAGRHIQLSRLDPIDTAFSLIMKHRPAYVSGHPAILLELAHEIERRRLRIDLSGATTFGSHVTPEIRETFKQVFGANIMDRYASKEVYDIAYQCPLSNNLHVSDELMLVEVLDEHNKPCEFGRSGRVVVTPFYNTAQPLIRYELGDMVTLSERCVCGRHLSTITSLDGRTQHLFRLSGGRKLALRLPHNLKKSIAASEWQVAQVGTDAVEIRYLKKGTAPPEAFLNLENLIRSQMTSQTVVSFRPMTKLPLAPSGKLLEMVCELPHEPT